MITLKAWPDDHEWATAVGSVIEDGLPVFEHTIGSAMPFAALTISEMARVDDFGHPSDLDVADSRLLMAEGSAIEGHAAVHPGTHLVRGGLLR